MYYNYIFLFYRSVKIKKPLVRSFNSVHIFIFIILFICFTFVFKLHYFLIYLFIYSVTSLDYYVLFDLVIYLVMILLFFGKHRNSVYITYFYYYLFVYMHSYLYIYLLFEVTNKYYYYHLIILTNYSFENKHTHTNKMMLKIATLNIRGIQSNKTSIKIEKLLLLQKTHHFDILFLQETHLTNIEYATYITKNWKGKWFWSFGEHLSKGVGIFI